MVALAPAPVRRSSRAAISGTLAAACTIGAGGAKGRPRRAPRRRSRPRPATGERGGQGPPAPRARRRGPGRRRARRSAVVGAVRWRRWACGRRVPALVACRRPEHVDADEPVGAVPAVPAGAPLASPGRAEQRDQGRLELVPRLAGAPRALGGFLGQQALDPVRDAGVDVRHARDGIQDVLEQADDRAVGVACGGWPVNSAWATQPAEQRSAHGPTSRACAYSGAM